MSNENMNKLQQLLDQLNEEAKQKELETQEIEEEELQEEDKEYVDNFENYRKNIVATVAYLIGVPDAALHTDTRFNQETIEKLEKDNNANIIRALTTLRTQFFVSHSQIQQQKLNMISIENMSDLLDVEKIKFLRKNGIEVGQVNYKNYKDVIINVAYINQALLENIDSIKNYIPGWVNFEYIKNLFLMPNCYAGPKGNTLTSKAKAIAKSIHETRGIYIKLKNAYPFQCYITCPTKMLEEKGNILFNDAKFLKLLYAYNHDIFKAVEYVVDATIDTKENIYNYIDSAFNVEIFVDCENADPYLFAATMLNLSESRIKKIKKIVLYDDIHTSMAWDYISEKINIPVEHNMIDRLLYNKSLVDQAVTIGMLQSFYEDSVESVILVSSDSDFWEVMKQMKGKMNFFVMNERRTTSYTMIQQLDNENIGHCYVDDFARDKVQDFKRNVLYIALTDAIDRFNASGTFEILDYNDFISSLFRSACIMGAPEQIEQEKQNFISTYLKKGFTLKPLEDDNGNIRFTLAIA